MNGWLKSAAVGVGCGGLGGCLYLAASVGTPGALVLIYMTQLPLFVAGLWLGTNVAVVAGVTGALVLFAASDLMGAALFAALNAVPVVLLVRQALLARRGGDGTLLWYPPGLLMAWLTILALAGLATAILLLGGPESLHATLRGVVAEVLDRVAALQPIANREIVAETMATVIPGIVAASWMISSIGSAALAQGVLARFGANWRPSPHLAALGLPMWIPATLGLAAAATIVAGPVRFVGINTMIALSVPFALAGLAVLHAAAQRLSQPAMALVCFYTVAALFGWPFLAIAVLGLLESWLHLRHRLAPHG
jgi:hypothetical protein